MIPKCPLSGCQLVPKINLNNPMLAIGGILVINKNNIINARATMEKIDESRNTTFINFSRADKYL
jgi:hypothetical protein